MNRVYINNTLIGSGDLLTGSNPTNHAMVGETLSVDQLLCVVNTEDQPFIPADLDYPMVTADHRIYTRKNDIDVSEFKDGDEVLYYDGETLAGKYFFEKVVQQGMYRYKITAVSIIGRLLNSRHYGGVYTGAVASTIFADILAGTNYILDPDVASATVTGYLPIATRRDNLQQLLIATGATVRIDVSGQIYISSMSPVQTGVFSPSRAYIGGSVTISKPVAGVKLTEHNYFPAGNDVTLFSDGVDGEELIEFNQPYHSLTIEGGTIIASGANFARISAKGTVTLTGKPYTHVTRIVTAGTVDAGSTENVKNVSNCYLANPQIAQALVERFYAYLQCNKTITQDVITGTERAGDVVSVVNPYTMELEAATIKRFDTTMSAANKAKAEFLVGFVPQGTISGFKNHVLLTGSGSYTIPTGVTKIRIILVGAGSGGSGGRKGQNGGDAQFTEDEFLGVGDGGSGGAAGKAGTGGRIFEISLDVSGGQVFSYTCGTGGKGGTGQTETAAATEGAVGTATTFGGYSSNYGRLYPYGYAEVKTGLTLAEAGADGFNGGSGGEGNDQQYWWDENDDWHYYYAEDGESVNGYAGGHGGHYTERSISERNSYEYYGGGGGGAANGNKGGDAPSYSGGYSSAGGVGAKGGNGANAANYGQGGGAGNGGGGGGGGGKAFHWNPTFDASAWMGGPGGVAGLGGNGGNGANGCIIIYY